jgi:hypothetical protein
MREKPEELMKKSGQDTDISVSVTEALTPRGVSAGARQEHGEGQHPPCHGIKYVSGPGQDGTVLILRDPFISNTRSAKARGRMETIDDFVRKAPAGIPADRIAADKGQERGCGTGCG